MPKLSDRDIESGSRPIKVPEGALSGCVASQRNCRVHDLLHNGKQFLVVATGGVSPLLAELSNALTL